jgi:hypothetical protein
MGSGCYNYRTIQSPKGSQNRLKLKPRNRYTRRPFHTFSTPSVYAPSTAMSRRAENTTGDEGLRAYPQITQITQIPENPLEGLLYEQTLQPGERVRHGPRLG